MSTTSELNFTTDRLRQSLLLISVATILVGIARIADNLFAQSHKVTLPEATTLLSLVLVVAGLSLLLLGVLMGRR